MSGFNPILVLVALNVLFFIAVSVSRDVKEFLGFFPALILERPWSIITAMFVHSDIWHLFFNMFALFFFGRTMISLTGANKFLLVYFIGGVAGNILFWALNMNNLSFLIGASGAVYAIAGVLVVLVPRMTVNFWGVIPMPLWVFVGIFLVLFSLPPLVSIGIAWQAHMGGLAAGLAAGLIFKRGGSYHGYR
jgi:membrane associated rhomboid family serine protease